MSHYQSISRCQSYVNRFHVENPTKRTIGIALTTIFGIGALVPVGLGIAGLPGIGALTISQVTAISMITAGGLASVLLLWLAVMVKSAKAPQQSQPTQTPTANTTPAPNPQPQPTQTPPSQPPAPHSQPQTTRTPPSQPGRFVGGEEATRSSPSGPARSEASQSVSLPTLRRPTPDQYLELRYLLAKDHRVGGEGSPGRNSKPSTLPPLGTRQHRVYDDDRCSVDEAYYNVEDGSIHFKKGDDVFSFKIDDQGRVSEPKFNGNELEDPSLYLWGWTTTVLNGVGTSTQLTDEQKGRMNDAIRFERAALAKTGEFWCKFGSTKARNAMFQAILDGKSAQEVLQMLNDKPDWRQNVVGQMKEVWDEVFPNTPMGASSAAAPQGQQLELARGPQELTPPEPTQYCRMFVPGQNPNLFQGKQVQRDNCEYVEVSEPGGAANIGYHIKKRNGNAKVGIQVAGNSGSPGGAAYKLFADPTGYVVGEHQLNNSTQEESLIGNWILTETQELPDQAQKKNKEQELYQNSLQNQWGYRWGDTTSDCTLQGPDYRISTDPKDYEFGHIVKGEEIRLSQVEGTGDNKNIKRDTAYPVTLIFTSAANAHASRGDPTSSMDRTLNIKAKNETDSPYPFYTSTIKATIRAFLLSCVEAGVDYPVIGLAGAGIYAGNSEGSGRSEHPRRVHIKTAYPQLIEEVMAEEVGPRGEKLGQYFKGAVFAKIGGEHSEEAYNFVSQPQSLPAATPLAEEAPPQPLPGLVDLFEHLQKNSDTVLEVKHDEQDFLVMMDGGFITINETQIIYNNGAFEVMPNPEVTQPSEEQLRPILELAIAQVPGAGASLPPADIPPATSPEPRVLSDTMLPEVAAPKEPVLEEQALPPVEPAPAAPPTTSEHPMPNQGNPQTFAMKFAQFVNQQQIERNEAYHAAKDAIVTLLNNENEDRSVAEAALRNPVITAEVRAIAVDAWNATFPSNLINKEDLASGTAQPSQSELDAQVAQAQAAATQEAPPATPTTSEHPMPNQGNPQTFAMKFGQLAGQESIDRTGDAYHAAKDAIVTLLNSGHEDRSAAEDALRNPVITAEVRAIAVDAWNATFPSNQINKEDLASGTAQPSQSELYAQVAQERARATQEAPPATPPVVLPPAAPAAQEAPPAATAPARPTTITMGPPLPHKEIPKEGEVRFLNDDLYESKETGFRKRLGILIATLFPGETRYAENDFIENLPMITFVKGECTMILSFRDPKTAQRMCHATTEKGYGATLVDHFQQNDLGSFYTDMKLEGADNVIGFLNRVVGNPSEQTKKFIESVSKAKEISYAAPQTTPSRGRGRGRGRGGGPPISSYPDSDFKKLMQANGSIQTDTQQTCRFKREEASGIVVPEQIEGNGLSAEKVIGAASTLLVPGVNSRTEALTLENLCEVEWEAGRLVLHFPREKDAKLTHSGLLKYFTEIVLSEKSIAFTDVEETTIYLHQVCQLTREQIESLEGDSPFLTAVMRRAQGIRPSQELFVDGEEVKVMFGPAATFDASRFKFDTTLRSPAPSIPALPHEAQGIGLDSILTMFDQHADAIIEAGMLIDEESYPPRSLSKQKAKGNILQMIQVVRGDITTYSGLPNNPVEKKKYQDRHRLIFMHVIYMMNHLDPENEDHVHLTRAILANFALGGSHCAGRYSSELLEAYKNLTAQTELPLYFSRPLPEKIAGMKEVDIQLFKVINKILIEIRQKIFDTEIFSHFQQGREWDLSHYRRFLMEAIGKEMDIPGWEAAEYDDVYGTMGGRGVIDPEDVKQLFLVHYNPQAVVEELCSHFNGMKPSASPTEELVNSFQFHTEELDISSLFQESDYLDPDEQLPVLQEKMLQVLTYFGFIQAS